VAGRRLALDTSSESEAPESRHCSNSAAIVAGHSNHRAARLTAELQAVADSIGLQVDLFHARNGNPAREPI
jgi:hypothetical protein